eukprot:SM000060S19601  [mRNA]  locus=s60:50121:56863:- [translate_table: standard]
MTAGCSAAGCTGSVYSGRVLGARLGSPDWPQRRAVLAMAAPRLSEGWSVSLRSRRRGAGREALLSPHATASGEVLQVGTSNLLEDSTRQPFDVNLAVVLAGFAFDAYNTPKAANGVAEMDELGSRVDYLSMYVQRHANPAQRREFAQEIFSGQLLVKLKRAFSFPGLDSWGTSDPYVRLCLGNGVLRSRTIWLTRNPVWNEDLRLLVTDPVIQTLQISAWDANVVLAHRPMGSTSVPLRDLCDGDVHDLELLLTGTGGGATLLLQVCFQRFEEMTPARQGWQLPTFQQYVAAGKALGDMTPERVVKAFSGLQALSTRTFLRSAIQASRSPESEQGNQSSSECGEADGATTASSSSSQIAQDVTRQASEGAAPSLSEAGSGDGMTSLESSSSPSEPEKQISLRERLLSAAVGTLQTYGWLSRSDSDHEISSASDTEQKTWQSNCLELVYKSSKTVTVAKEDSGNEELESKRDDLVSQAAGAIFDTTESLLSSVFIKGTLEERKLADRNSFVENGILQERGGNDLDPDTLEPEEIRQGRLKSGSKQSLTPEEMEKMRMMFASAESAVEAWAMLAKSLGQSSFLKSEYEKIFFIDNDFTDTQVAVWRDQRRRRIVVAFRGTEQTKLRDLLTDLNMVPTGFIQAQSTGDCKAGDVDIMVFHCSCAQRLLQCYESVRSRLLALLEAVVMPKSDDSGGKPWHVYTTGHSLGGALATLFAKEVLSSRLAREGLVSLTMYNFGSPRVGNTAFVQCYDQEVKDSWRIINHRDIIPTVPRLMGYCHGAQPVYLSDSQGPVNEDDTNIEDGYQVDMMEGTSPSVLFDQFMKGERQVLSKLLQTEIAMLQSIRDGSALSQHLENYYYISLLQKVQSNMTTPRDA